MRRSLRCAREAVHELERHGWLKVTYRVTAQGDPDVSEYEITAPGESGTADTAAGVGHILPEGTAISAAKDSNLKTARLKGESRSASRHARAASRASTSTTTDKIASVRRAVIITYLPGDNESLDDEEALDIWARFIGERFIQDPVNYLCRIFEDFPSLDGVLSNTPERDIA